MKKYILNIHSDVISPFAHNVSGLCKVGYHSSSMGVPKYQQTIHGLQTRHGFVHITEHCRCHMQCIHSFAKEFSGRVKVA